MAPPSVSFSSSSSFLQDASSCNNFDPVEAGKYIAEHPVRKTLLASSWSDTDGLGAALTAADLIKKHYPNLPARFHIAWTFFIREKKESERNSLTNLCFDPSYYTEDDQGEGRWGAEKRAFLITEVCGEAYVTDLVNQKIYQGYPIDFVFSGISTDSLRNSLEFFFKKGESPLLFRMGEMPFVPMSMLDLNDPYREAGFVNEYLPGHSYPIEQVSPSQIFFRLRDLKKMLGVCP